MYHLYRNLLSIEVLSVAELGAGDVEVRGGMEKDDTFDSGESVRGSWC